MPRVTIDVSTTPEEQAKVLEALRKIVVVTEKSKSISVSTIASKACMNANRVRYILLDLEEAGKIAKVPVKAFNPHYIRYRYEVLV